MVEVFKTDVEDPMNAAQLLDHIHATFPNYQSNFDLDDCDRVLRISNENGRVESDRVIQIVAALGYTVERLE